MAAGVQADLAAAAGGYAVHVSDRLHSLPSRELGNIVFAAPDTLGLMMIGMLLLRSGLLTGRFERSEAWRLTRWIALAAGVPLLVLATWLWAGGFPTGRSEFVYFLIAYPFNIALTVAWAAGLAAWASAATGWLARALEATGRAAFTNYIATSLVMTTLFYGYGGGLFGQANRWQAWLFVLCGAALMLAWSRPWLTRFRYGPLEWLWRSAARGRLQPMAGGCFGAPMLRRLYDWTLAKAAHPLAERWLAGLSFAESSVFPIPPDIVLIPMCLADPRRAWRYAAICTVASVLGALLGYAIGAFLFDAVGRPVLAFYGLSEGFEEFRERFLAGGWLFVLVAGFSPVPFKLATIASGAVGLPLPVLLAAAAISRAARFGAEAALLRWLGEPARALIERHFGLLTLAVAVIGVGGFVAVKYLM